MTVVEGKGRRQVGRYTNAQREETITNYKKHNYDIPTDIEGILLQHNELI